MDENLQKALETYGNLTLQALAVKEILMQYIINSNLKQREKWILIQRMINKSWFDIEVYSLSNPDKLIGTKRKRQICNTAILKIKTLLKNENQ